MVAPLAEEALARGPDTDLELLQRLEWIAEEVDRHTAADACEQAIEFLIVAYVQGGGTDDRILRHSQLALVDTTAAAHETAEAATAVVRFATAGVCLLLCRAYSRLGAHLEALHAAQAASDEINHTWQALLQCVDIQNSVPVRLRDLIALEFLLTRGPATLPWLNQLAEVSIQTKHVLALEMERMNAPAADIERLHLEGSVLASHLLPADHAVSSCVGRVFERWAGRACTVERGTDTPCDGDGQEAATGGPTPLGAVELLRMLAGLAGDRHQDTAAAAKQFGAEIPGHFDLASTWPAPKASFLAPRPYTCPFSKVDRLYLGLRSPVDMRQERIRTKQKATMRRAASAAAALGSEANVRWDPIASSGTAASSWSTRSASPGTLYSRSVQWGPDGLPKGPNWKSCGRVPILTCMTGCPGKASWALKCKEGGRISKNEKGKMSVFDAWRKDAGSDAAPLKSRVCQSWEGQAVFLKSLRTESRRFNNLWLKEEVDAEALAEDCILFCPESMALKKNAARRAGKELPQITPKAVPGAQLDGVCTALFTEYGLKCRGPKVGLPDLRKLAEASDSRLDGLSHGGTPNANKGRRHAQPA